MQATAIVAIAGVSDATEGSTLPDGTARSGSRTGSRIGLPNAQFSDRAKTALVMRPITGSREREWA